MSEISEYDRLMDILVIQRTAVSILVEQYELLEIMPALSEVHKDIYISQF